MSEKGKEIEKEEGDGREMLHHWSHEHPLTLVDTRDTNYCYGCEERFSSGEQAYGCSINGCDYSNLLHEECATMARKIRHPSHHPQHILTQQHQKWVYRCDICKQIIRSIGYRCNFRGTISATTDDDDDSGGDDDDKVPNIIQHPSHPNHELKSLKRRSSFNCDACGTTRRGSSYMCTTDACGYRIHQRCTSVPQNIEMEGHPHSLSLSYHVPQEYSMIYGYTCVLCSKYLPPQCWIYHCRICGYIVHIKCALNEPSYPLCGFEMHLRCAQGYTGIVDANDEQRSNIIHHPSHPNHELKLFRRRCSFNCDACGTTRKGSSYTCTNDACQYWIHETCASLSLNFKREDHHHYLSLSFHVPFEYLNFNFKCDVCHNFLPPNYWIYHCQICRYIVHVKCAFVNKPPLIDENIGKDMIRLPTNEVAEELITPFVVREKGGGTFIPPITIPNDGDELVNMKYNFLHHQHQLTLVSSDHNQEEEEQDEENYGVRSELMCDGCITPISSSSSSNSKCYYYMSCSECKYNLHMPCFHLPPRLPSLPLHHHQDDNHHLLLQSCDKLQPWKQQYCRVCRYHMNGLYYTCGECDFTVDIKCASMPDTIHHAAHPHHLLKHVTQSDLSRDMNSSLRLLCAAGCGSYIPYYDCYRCCSSPCDFIVHVRCAVLPASVSSRRWDKRHPLLLTYDATLNRPGDFYCDQCETQMNPKSWMYHCRTCDISFHPECFKTTSGEYRNMKLGQEYVNAATHPHCLTFQLLTTKRCCNICRWNVHEAEGFYCALCNFFICLYSCGRKMIENGDTKAAD